MLQHAPKVRQQTVPPTVEQVCKDVSFGKIFSFIYHVDLYAQNMEPCRYPQIFVGKDSRGSTTVKRINAKYYHRVKYYRTVKNVFKSGPCSQIHNSNEIYYFISIFFSIFFIQISNIYLFKKTNPQVRF